MPANKTILIPTTTFYPDRRVAAVRMTQWCRHLPDLGWQCRVMSRYYGLSATADEVAASVHPDVRLCYYNAPPTPAPAQAQPSPTPAGIKGLRATARRAVFKRAMRLMAPDASRVFWRGVRAETLAALDREAASVVITSGPPHSIHDLGRWLKRMRPQVRWVADFRDPYLMDPRFGPRGPARLWWKAHAEFEKSVYHDADLVTHAIPLHERWARARYPAARDKIRLLENGCPMEIADRRLTPIPPADGAVAVRVMGANDPSYRAQLVRVVLAMREQGHDVELSLIGRDGVDDGALRQQLGDRFVSTGQVPHGEAMQQILGGDVLVAVLDETRSQCMGLSSKLYEYLGCGKAVVIVNPTRPDVAFLRGYRGVRSLTRPTDAQLRDALLWALKPESQPPAEQTEFVRTQLSRQAQVKTLAGWLESLV